MVRGRSAGKIRKRQPAVDETGVYTSGRSMDHAHAQRLGDRPDFQEWMAEVMAKLEARRENASPGAPRRDPRASLLARWRRLAATLSR